MKFHERLKPIPMHVIGEQQIEHALKCVQDAIANVSSSDGSEEQLGQWEDIVAYIENDLLYAFRATLAQAENRYIDRSRGAV